MPSARPLPRKFLSQIEDSQSVLKQIAAKSRIAIERIESDRQSVDQLGTLLREIEVKSYQVALDLAEIEVAEGCEECPAAPPMTTDDYRESASTCSGRPAQYTRSRGQNVTEFSR